MIITRGFGENQAVITRRFAGVKYATGFQMPKKIDDSMISEEGVLRISKDGLTSE